MDVLKLKIERQLPSWNVAAKWHWRKWQQEQKNWALVVNSNGKLPRFKGSVRIDVYAYFGDTITKTGRRGRAVLPDPDNQCVKFLLDALRRQVIKDDNIRVITDLKIHGPRPAPKGEMGYTEVKIERLGA